MADSAGSSRWAFAGIVAILLGLLNTAAPTSSATAPHEDVPFRGTGAAVVALDQDVSPQDDDTDASWLPPQGAADAPILTRPSRMTTDRHRCVVADRGPIAARAPPVSRSTP